MYHHVPSAAAAKYIPQYLRLSINEGHGDTENGRSRKRSEKKTFDLQLLGLAIEKLLGLNI